ncbi:MAG: hypothetical protein CL758_07475 [Chloroflexi bacterium]|nr:hypothetical protein [Chloroflexota bacterium]|tara:strand:- start:837 stop:1397 length:561 start_codon:yes stop_codon:yes gene_type:complete
MNTNNITLKSVIKDDVLNVQRWLENELVADSWFGRYSYGDFAHLGYHPEEMAHAHKEEWDKVFSDPEHKIFSIYHNNEHVGESHLAIEESLGDAQLSILIGDPNNWHKGYGTAAAKATIKMAFEEFRIFRIWVDIPEYNEDAINMFSHMNFTHEGTLRKSRPHHGARHNSVIMGILVDEYNNSEGY